MPLGAVSLPAVNMPAPKIPAASLLQRSIGNQPGPWGVAGTFAVLASILGVWLITEPQSLRPSEPALSLRRTARWSSVLLTGGALGVLLGGYPISYGRDQRALLALLGTLALVELPANTLLYLHL